MRTRLMILAGLAMTVTAAAPARQGYFQVHATELRIVDDASGHRLRRDRVDGPDGERLLLSERRLTRQDIAGVLIRPGLQRLEVTSPQGSRVLEPGAYSEMHVLLAPERWDALSGERPERIAALQGGRVTAVWAVLAVRPHELVLASESSVEAIGRRLGSGGALSEAETSAKYWAWLKQRIGAAPEDQDTLALLADESLVHVQDCERGEELLEPMLARGASDSGAMGFLSQLIGCYGGRGDDAAILRISQHILQERPEVGNAMDLRDRLASMYEAQGDTARAEEELTAYVEYLKMSTRVDKDDRIRQAVATIELLRQTASASESEPAAEPAGQQL